MAESETLKELDAHERRVRVRKLLFTAVPLFAIFGVYSVLAVAVVKSSSDLEKKRTDLVGKTAALDAKTKELEDSEKELVSLQEQRQKLAVDVATLREEAADLDSKKKEMLKTIAENASAATKVEKLERVLIGGKTSARTRAASLWREGYAAYNAGDLVRAKLLYAKALAADSRYVAAIHNRALVAKQQGRLAEASSLTEQALSIRSGYQPSLILKADIEKAQAPRDAKKQ